MGHKPASGADEGDRAARAQEIGLFRYALIRPVADPALTTRQRGPLVRQLAEQDHLGPFGDRVRVSRVTLDRWIRAWKAGGFDALVPCARHTEPHTAASVLELAAALKREVPGRTAAQVAVILGEHAGCAPSARTLQRHFARLELGTRPDGSPPAAFGRFEAAAPNDRWTGDALHGPVVAGRKTYLFAFIDDHSRALTGYRWGHSEDTVRLEAALRNGISCRGIPRVVYLDNGSAMISKQLMRALAVLGIQLTHSKPRQPAGRGKIERVFRTVREQFLIELAVPGALAKIDGLEQLNELFTAWVETVYHQRVHSETGQAPCPSRVVLPTGRVLASRRRCSGCPGASSSSLLHAVTAAVDGQPRTPRSDVKRQRVLGLLLATALAGGPTMMAQADPGSKPNGPWVIDEQTVQLNSLRSYEELVKGLNGITARSAGVSTLGWGKYTSNLGRGIPYVEVGNGPTAVIIAAQQHGNEMETSDSVVALARYLSGSSAQAEALRAKLTMVLVPRVNVDGFDGKLTDGTPITDTRGNVTPWRQNYDPRFTTAPLPAFYTLGRGYDINRYHAFRPECPLDNPNWPNITTGVTSCETTDWASGPAPYDVTQGSPVPEAKTVRALFDKYQPVAIMDFHHQGTLVDSDGRMITGSTLWPTAEASADRLESVDPQARERFDAGQLMARKVVSVLVDSIQRYGYANISRYPGGTEPGISRNAYGLLGSGSVLLELRGGIGQKSNGYIQKIGYQVGMSVLTEIARDPALGHVSTATADGLQLGTPVSSPHGEEGGETH